MYPALISALAACAVLELWIVFALVYAGLQRYERTMKDAGRGRLGLKH
jgi:hypothetical protein